MLDVAIVILNWNGEKMLRRFLPALVRSISSDNCFVVVADNGSTDGSISYLESEFPQVRTIRFDENSGFTGGYNRALREIDADYYVLLNSDVETPQGWLDALVSFMEENPDAGICQPKILSEVSRDKFEYAGAAGGFIDRYGYPFCRGRILSSVEKDCGQYDSPLECFWATGACLMIRSSLFHHLGGFDESFFAHMEEIDLCWRAKLLGYHVWCVPQSYVFHVGGGTLPANSPRKLYLNYRNNLLMLHKNLPESIRSRRIFIRQCLDGAAAAVYLLTGKWRYFRAVVKAHSDFRKMRASLDESPFDEERNNVGYYPHSIVLKYILSRGRLKFSDIKKLN
ncbi:MAG: glycosyltransferase family 2 protein [Bacteroidales bacterium]|nr:glycosyltransferase family 2 protein [Candidatus Cacconaster merdequi]